MKDHFDMAIQARFEDVVRGPEDMHGYQRDAVQFFREHPFVMGCLDLGLGKSVSAGSFAAELVADFEDVPILIIGPLKVVTDTWPTEFSIWRQMAWLKWTLIRVDDDDPRLAAVRKQAKDEARRAGLSSSEATRLAQIAETAERERIKEDCARQRTHIHLINREQVEWLVYFWKDKWPYRTVIFDESSSAKDHTSLRFKALAKVRQTPGLITRFINLTATPAAETYIHLFPQIYLLDLGQRLGKNITAFRDKYFTYNKYSMKYKLRPGAEQEILEKIADISIVMKARDHLSRAEPTVIAHKVKLDQKQIALTKQLEEHFIMRLPDGTEIEAKTAAILSSMLLQMASGSVYETVLEGDWETDDLTKVKKVHHLHDHKVLALKEIAEEAATQGEPLLVAYHFQSSLAKLRKAFPKATVMDKEGKCIKPWNAGKIPMLLIHPQSAGHGLNLQHGGHILVFYDLIYSLENYLQTIGRIDRQGQKKPVIVKLLVAEGTRDVDVFKALSLKQDAQEKLFRILKRLIRELKSQRQKIALST